MVLFIFVFLRKKRFYKLLTIFLLFIFLVLSFGIQLSFSRKAFSAYTLTDEKIRAFNWLNENTPKDSVVGALGLETNTLIPVYTHNNVFLPNGGVTLAPTKEITKRIYIIYKLFGITPEYLDEVLAYSPEKEREKEKNCFLDQCLKNRRLNIVEEEKAMSFFHMQDTVFQEGLTGWSYKVGVPPKERMGIVGDYKKFLESSVYLPHDLRLDYIFFGAEEKKITKVNLKKYDFLLPVYQEEGVEIYKVKDQKQ